MHVASSCGDQRRLASRKAFRHGLTLRWAGPNLGLGLLVALLPGGLSMVLEEWKAGPVSVTAFVLVAVVSWSKSNAAYLAPRPTPATFSVIYRRNHILFSKDSGESSLLVMGMAHPTDGDEATASSTSSSDADGAGSGKDGDVAGEPVELPLHLVEEIVGRMSLVESARLATVCKSWAAAASARLPRRVPHLFVFLYNVSRESLRVKGLVVSVQPDGAVGRAWLPPSAATPACMRSADTKELQCIGATPSGRIAFGDYWSRNGRLVVLNPVTGALQSISLTRLRNQLVLVAGRSDAFLAIYYDKLVIWWRAGGGDEWSQWTVLASRRQTSLIFAAVNCNGCFYMLHLEGYLSMIDTTKPPPLRVERLPVVSLLEVDPSDPPLPGCPPSEKVHLLESDGEVLLVRQLVAYKEVPAVFCDHREFPSIVGFEVFRLELKDRCWTKVKTLGGDRALFVSRRSSFMMHTSEMAGCMSNCIYFVGRERYCFKCRIDGGMSWGVYSMEDQHILFEHVVTDPGRCMESLWFLPSVV
ncbi:hypothetical protein ACP70R_023103 [Stipagrostis hirtigluma subsp. patula]